MLQFLWMMVALLGVLGLMFLTFYGLRMFNSRISTSGGRLKVVDRATLGRDSMLLVVSVCGRLILVGVSSQRVEKLADLEMTEEEYVEVAFSGSNKGTAVFSEILSNMSNMIVKKNKNENNENDGNEQVENETNQKEQENDQNDKNAPYS